MGSGSISPRGVYPRACGGTQKSPCAATTTEGLSPRMRGNPRRGERAVAPDGSIPAHAGEPVDAIGACTHSTVYPRACGGTTSRTCGSSPYKGLSPRMRGNPVLVHDRFCILGSIPAHAGEPAHASSRPLTAGVYPRACGGTGIRKRYPLSRYGLSPRMRGNQIPAQGGSGGRGSIPAHAGEPAASKIRRTCHGVYPRACGGTPSESRAVRIQDGLSPRMRGNPEAGEAIGAKVRSIPAHAGEPVAFCRAAVGAGVYPRACGGTICLNRVAPTNTGLSPRMRGNPIRSAR